MSVEPLITVVLPVLDGLPWIEFQLDALTRQDCSLPWELVVADNGSSDGTAEVVTTWADRDDRIRLIDASATAGPGAARNRGVATSSSRLLAFCDADDIVQPGWLTACGEALQDVDAAAGTFDFTLLNGGGPSLPVAAATKQLAFLPAALGSNMCVRRQAFESVGGFCEDLLVGEDIDFSWRLQLAGHSFAVIGDAVVAKREPLDARRVFSCSAAYGRSGADLFRRFQSAGMGRDLEGATKEWLWLVLSSVGLFDPARRVRWMRTLGLRTGRLLGSFQQRVFFP
jgi:glycosyltransferase involved in cell wall biosynthesis